MAKSTCILAVTIAALSTCGVLSAADSNGHFMVRGAGRADCARFLEAQKTRSTEFVSFAGWLDGYLTAFNQAESSTFDLAPWQETELLLSAVSAWCKKNPEQTFHQAAYAMSATLRNARLQARSDIVAVQAGEKTIVLYAEVVKRIQQKLHLRGLLQANPSGTWDEPTITALKAFQTEKKLPVTGLPDQTTLLNLL